MTWNPEQYLKFEGPRLRPAADLIARLSDLSPGLAYDLGCGTGNVTRLLQALWPKARLIGVDSAPAMIAKAARDSREAGLATLEWQEADLAGWAPERPPDLIFSNAALHWLDGHASLFPRLFANLAPGGVLAVQMPGNFKAPSHAELFAAAEAGPWAGRLSPLLRQDPVLSPSDYWALLKEAGAAAPDIWETTYLQALTGDNPVVAWTKGTVLAPLLDALDEPWRSAFLAEYGPRIARAYPQRPDGTTLFPFRRIFILARKAG